MHRLRLFLRHGLVSSGCPTASRRICALLPTTSILSQSSSSSRRLPPASPMTAAPPVRFSPTSSSLTLDPPYNRSLSLPPLSPPIRAWVRPHTPGPLSPTQLEQFYQWGYVTVPHLLHPSDLHPSMRAIEAQVDEVARALHRAGRLSDLCEGADFRTRLTRLEAQSPSASVLLHKRGQLPQAMWGLWSHPRLMAIAQQVLGPDVSAHPNWSLRSKTPHQEQATVPWHQDAAYLQPDADETLQMTAWIPFVDADVRNGCMQVLRGGHRAGCVVPHLGCTGSTWYIETDASQMPQCLHLPIDSNVVTVPVSFGSVLLLNNLVPHRSLPNSSDHIRWSVDVRWQRPDQPSGFPAKPLLRLSRAGDPTFRPDWSVWADMDRHHLVQARVRQERGVREDAAAPSVADEDALDTTIVGPWMSRWPLVHRNRHTERWEALQRMTAEQRKRQEMDRS